MTEKQREDAARALGKNRSALRKRLLEARSVLTDEYRRIFKDYTYDFDRQRLVSKADPTLCIQWRIREYPDAPIDYHNQQIRDGVCSVERIN